MFIRTNYDLFLIRSLKLSCYIVFRGKSI